MIGFGMVLLVLGLVCLAAAGVIPALAAPELNTAFSPQEQATQFSDFARVAQWSGHVGSCGVLSIVVGGMLLLFDRARHWMREGE